VHRLDQISAKKPAKLSNSKSLTLDFSRRQIWPVFLPYSWIGGPHGKGMKCGVVGRVPAPAGKLGKTSPLRCRSRTCPVGVVQQLAPRRGRATLPVAYPSAAVAVTRRAFCITALSRLAYSLGDGPTNPRAQHEC
jgi:hypothetical protein